MDTERNSREICPLKREIMGVWAERERVCVFEREGESHHAQEWSPKYRFIMDTERNVREICQRERESVCV
jgi:hypothetical protein